MKDNFIFGVQAVVQDIYHLLIRSAYNKIYLSFILGAVVSMLIIALVYSENPKHISFMLRHTSAHAFQKTSENQRDNGGTYTKSYTQFVRMYLLIKLAFFIAFACFCIMVVTILLASNPQ
ncbi:MAG: hypothetical protein ABII02_04095 [Candidatus Magasanikbacteria bacterium]